MLVRAHLFTASAVWLAQTFCFFTTLSASSRALCTRSPIPHCLCPVWSYVLADLALDLALSGVPEYSRAMQPAIPTRRLAETLGSLSQTSFASTLEEQLS